MVTSRIWFTAKQKAELWERWKKGQSIVIDLPGAGAQEQDRRPADRISPWRHCSGAAAQSCGGLRLAEREEISRGIAAGRSIRRIARSLGRSPSTICREIERNGGCADVTVQPGPTERLGAGAAPEALSPGAPYGATMAGGAEAGAAMVAGADRGLAEAAVPGRPRHADIS